MNRRPNRKNGFTLIEILAVVAIIIVVAGLVIGITGVVTGKMDRAKTNKELSLLNKFLDDYRNNAPPLGSNKISGIYPPDLNELFKYLDKNKNNGVDKNEDGYKLGNLVFQSDKWICYDPWGSEYVYTRQTLRTYRLGSLGPDGRAGVANLDDDGTGGVDNSTEIGLGDDVFNN